MNSDLINIKNKYGERMMHLCRKLFPTILEEEGKLFDILKLHFVYSKYLYEDIVDNNLIDMFKNYIYSLVYPNDKKMVEIAKTPYELLSDVGYILYECKSEEDIQAFRKYYASNEGLCSFRGGRLDDCYVFFAVKNNVDEIKREDFINPMRQDLYGTSVISIQFTRGNVNTLSIKNRYNHTVLNPDATYSNNLENIVSGLTRSFERMYNLNISQNESGYFEIPGYVRVKNGKYYKYNYEINNVYYCPDNIIIDDFEVIDKYQEKEKYIIMDYFILDLVEKKICLYDNMITDSFINGLSNIKKIDINKCKATKNKMIDIIFENGTSANIKIDKYNRIISYKNENITSILNTFLYRNVCLENIDIPNVVKIGHGFLTSNNSLKKINFSKLIEVGDGFLYQNRCINDVNLIKLVKVGRSFMANNDSLLSINMPNLECVLSDFLKKNKVLKEVFMPNLVMVGDNFLKYNKGLTMISFPNLAYVENGFIVANKKNNEVYLPNLVQIKDSFLYSNRELKKISLEKLRFLGSNFMFSNRCLVDVNFPLLGCIGSKFLYMNDSIIKLELPELLSVDKYFMYNNNSLKELFAPGLWFVGIYCLFKNDVLERVDVDFSSLSGDIKCFSNIDKNTKRRTLKANN